jgi:hypothetical protein
MIKEGFGFMDLMWGQSGWSFFHSGSKPDLEIVQSCLIYIATKLSIILRQNWKSKELIINKLRYHNPYTGQILDNPFKLTSLFHLG